MAEGTPLTFLFTDIVGSTVLWQKHGDEMPAVVEEHDARIERTAGEHGGRIFAGGGDGFGVVFDGPEPAVAAALSAQETLGQIEIGEVPLRVRMGMHTGTAQHRNDDYFGLTVNRAARIASAANGQQILISAATANLVAADFDLTELGEFRLADLFEPVRIFQAGATEFPPIRALDPDKHNLPVRFTSLVGRERLINDVAHRLEEKRLVTLVGPGGIGKTSVALEAAAQLSTRLERGAWLLELDEIEPGADLESEIAEVLGMTVAEGWRRTAAGRQQLLVLDNAEHLIDQVADVVAQLLRSGSEVRCLVTSREGLRVPGEQIVVVPPLTADEEAVSLFLDRAGGSTLEGSLVEGIVEAVDGMPLAIELVAAHAQSMSLAELSSSLSEHGLASFRTRGVAERHSSAEAAIQWSYDLLDEDEKRAFAALSLFTQDFSLAAAAAVGGLSLPRIRGLVEKSLLQRVSHRYRLLEPLKEFAASRLNESGERELAMARLAEFAISRITEVAARLKPRDPTWADEVQIGTQDLIAVAHWLADHRDLDMVRDFYLGLPGLVQASTLRHDGRELTQALVPVAARLEEDTARNRWLLYRQAWSEDLVGSETQARDRVEGLRPVAVEQGDELLVAACNILELRTLVSHPDSPSDRVSELFAAVGAGPDRSDWWEPGALHWLHGVYLLSTEQYALAEQQIRLSLEDPNIRPHNRQVGMLFLATALRDQGKHQEALGILEGIEEEHRRFFDEHALWEGVLMSRAHTLIAMERLDEAYEVIERLVALGLDETQPTDAPFCPAADYFRAKGDDRAAAWLLARMLDGARPFHPIHRNVIGQGKQALGEQFDEEWKRGEHMDILQLYGLIQEG